MNKRQAYTSYIHLLLGSLLLLYLIFPTHNDTLDSWAYAAEIKHGGTLFHPHHLLFNATHFLLLSLLPVAVPVIAWLKAVNAVMAYFSLRILVKILRIMMLTEQQILGWVLVVGSSFAVMRFATEGETYLLPVFFSLLGSFYFLKFSINRQHTSLLLAGTFCAMACLFHQIQIGWYLGLMLGAICLAKRKAWLILLPALLIPLVYVLVWKSIGSHEAFFQFINRDFYTGTATFSIGFKNVLLTAANFIRSFFQVHGIIPFFLRKSPWAYAAILSMILLLIWTIRKGGSIGWKDLSSPFQVFRYIHLGIFLLQLFLAFLSLGNAEFMVMLPFLLPLWIPAFISFRPQLLIGLGGILLIWNLTFGLFPRSSHTYYSHEKLIAFIRENPADYYLLKDKNLLANRLYYEEGEAFETPLRLISINSISMEEWIKLLEVAEAEQRQIYTDALDKPQLLSRVSLLAQSQLDLKTCEWNSLFSIPAYLGTYHVFQLKRCESTP